ncbi:HD-GYP domain, c-di-GMP phosphodiesterase class II (or its inactivated variant) [Pseudobutyrivibrio sp. UC1225]|uniref:HD-GYP domain-containing protein n=1 Tax=Pseudobutyrivibrio sp. UC1225 TaxID=1798185 RepID=UPI0008E87B6D|nr:HD-GYP domain-containing protein [Pseudobutyrivibrio sp. UC1225]SFO00789.1 HD-GYP domain, c-di-GMP phosphodiesterase class II (or its inactivated variant) [Pseudobutyrivibrio sp. UC1225]
MLEFFIKHQLDLMLALSSICGTIAIFVVVARALPLSRRIVLLFLELSAMALLYSDRLSYFYNGDISQLGLFMHRLSIFMDYLFTDVIVLAFNLYLIDLYKNEGKMKKTPLRLDFCTIFMIIGIILCIFCGLSGIYYTFDSNNIYSRGPGYIISYIFPFFVPLIQLTAIIKYKRYLDWIINLSNTLFIVVPLICSIAQLFIAGTSMTNIGIIITCIFIYVVALFNLNREMEEGKRSEIDFLKKEQESMQRLFEQTSSAFMGAVEAKDVFTLGHSTRVANYAKAIAKTCGKSDKECDEIYYAALLHDIGKVGLPESILNKRNNLNEEELKIYRRETIIGADILSNITEYPFLKDGAHFHHEKYDGSGYPENLKGDEIPEIARIIAVADYYDNLTSRKSDRDAYPQVIVREEFLKKSGTTFDPRFAAIMISLIDSDKDYKLRENVEDIDNKPDEYLSVNEYRSNVTKGILIDDKITKIGFEWSLNSDSPTGFSAPSIIVFDAYDGRIHSDEKSISAFGYLEFGEIWFNGHYNSTKAKNMEVTISQKSGSISEFYGAAYEMTAAKCGDHLKISISSDSEVIDVIMALPENSKYAYIGITGEYCNISNINIERTEEIFTDDQFTRIAPANNYINRLEGDLPNLQIDRFRSASSVGTLITDGLNCEFHTMSLPMANFIWNCPFIVVYSSDDGKVDGENYLEYALIQMNGELKSDSTLATNDPTVKKTREFKNWDTWKEKNKKGMDCHISFRISGDTLEMAIENSDFKIKNKTMFLLMPEKLYFSITGDQCAITDIRIYE